MDGRELHQGRLPLCRWRDGQRQGHPRQELWVSFAALLLNLDLAVHDATMGPQLRLYVKSPITHHALQTTRPLQYKGSSQLTLFSPSNAGYCFVEFPTPDSATKALGLNGTSVPNSTRQFKLNWASGGGLVDRRYV